MYVKIDIKKRRSTICTQEEIILGSALTVFQVLTVVVAIHPQLVGLLLEATEPDLGGTLRVKVNGEEGFLNDIVADADLLEITGYCST